jgi:hypothetical protein
VREKGGGSEEPAAVIQHVNPLKKMDDVRKLRPFFTL